MTASLSDGKCCSSGEFVDKIADNAGRYSRRAQILNATARSSPSEPCWGAGGPYVKGQIKTTRTAAATVIAIANCVFVVILLSSGASLVMATKFESRCALLRERSLPCPTRTDLVVGRRILRLFRRNTPSAVFRIAANRDLTCLPFMANSAWPPLSGPGIRRGNLLVSNRAGQGISV
jgi:hypothetical protein